MKSLWDITSHEIADDLHACYEYVKANLPPAEFERLMNSLAQSIKEVERKCKPGTGFIVAGLFLCTPEEDDTKDEEENRKYIKAAIVWYLLQPEVKI